MEDISRELEKEIRKTRPKALKKNPTAQMLIVDDNGNIRYGNHYKILLILLSIFSIISLCTSILFFHLYSSLSEKALSNKANLVSAKKTIEKLTREREQLIAKLVLLGEEPELLNNTEKATDSEIEQGTVSKSFDKKSPASKSISESITEEKIK
jgi:hypothetical protein